jgi:flavin-dependent dehydrogenase
VGDAAGQVKPTTGGGIYYSLLAADIAAETLDRTLRQDNLGSSALRKYDRQWKSALGTELRVGRFARSIFERLDGTTIASLLKASEASGLLEDEASFDWHSKIIIRWMGNRMFDAALAPFRAVGGVLSAIV